MSAKSKSNTFYRIQHTLVWPYLTGTLLGIMVATLPGLTLSARLSTACVMACVSSWTFRKIYLEMLDPGGEGLAAPDLKKKALESGAVEAEVRIDGSFSPETDWRGRILLPQHPHQKPELWATLAHEICHLKAGHVHKVMKITIGSSLTIALLSMQVISLLGTVTIKAAGLVWMMGALSSLLLWVSTHWLYELLADAGAVKLSSEVTWVNKSALLEKRVNGVAGLTLTHPPRFLRVWVTKLSK